MTRWKTEYHGHSKTYVVLFNTACYLMDMGEKNEKGRLLNLQAATVFLAFTFEAYLNHVGEEELAFWSEIDHISYTDKLKVLSKHLGFPVDRSRRPFQTIGELFTLRNTLAHGRTRKLKESITTNDEPPINAAWHLLPYERLTPEAVRRYYEDVKNAIASINEKRLKKDEMLWNQGMRGYNTID